MAEALRVAGGPECPRCGTVTEQTERIAPFGSEPGLRIFECSACGWAITRLEPRRQSNAGSKKDLNESVGRNGSWKAGQLARLEPRARMRSNFSPAYQRPYAADGSYLRQIYATQIRACSYVSGQRCEREFRSTRGTEAAKDAIEACS